MKQIDEITESLTVCTASNGTPYWKLITESGHKFNTFDTKMFEGLNKGDRIRIDYEENDKGFWTPKKVEKVDYEIVNPAKTIFKEAKLEEEIREIVKSCVKITEEAYGCKAKEFPEMIQTVNTLLIKRLR